MHVCPMMSYPSYGHLCLSGAIGNITCYCIMPACLLAGLLCFALPFAKACFVGPKGVVLLLRLKLRFFFFCFALLLPLLFSSPRRFIHFTLAIPSADLGNSRLLLSCNSNHTSLVVLSLFLCHCFEYRYPRCLFTDSITL